MVDTFHIHPIKEPPDKIYVIVNFDIETEGERFVGISLNKNAALGFCKTPSEDLEIESLEIVENPLWTEVLINDTLCFWIYEYNLSDLTDEVLTSKGGGEDIFISPGQWY